MRRIDWSWRSWGFRYDKGYYIGVDTLLGSVYVNSFRDPEEPYISRGRCREIEFRIPLAKRWQIELSTNGKDYLTLVNGPKYLNNLSWIIDEFDSSFNDLAIASLRYHMDYAVAVCDDHRRAVYQDLVDRLSEKPPCFTEEELLILVPPGADWMAGSSPEQSAIYDVHREREDAYRERIQQARHDFVDIMRGLWS